MNNLLLLSYCFPPAGGQLAAASVRLGKFAKYLPEFGWKSVVVSVGPGSFPLSDDTLTASDMPAKRIEDPMPLFRGRDRLARWLPSPGLLSLWAIRAVKVGTAIARAENCRLILASSPPAASFIAAYGVHLRTSLPLVLDYRDQWTLSPYRVGPRIYQLWDKWLEQRILRSAALVIVTNQGRRKEHEVYWGGVTPNTIAIPNGYDFRDFEGIEPDRTHVQQVNSGTIVIRHLGAIYGARAASTLTAIKALNQYLLATPDAPVVRLQLIGTVDERAISLDETISTKLIIERTGNVKRRDALILELGADVLLLILGRHAQSDAETSSKIFEYVASGRPVLVSGESGLLREITRSLWQVFWLGGSPVADSFRQFFSWLDGQLGGVSIDQARERLEKQYAGCDRRSQARELAALLSGVAKQR